MAHSSFGFTIGSAMMVGVYDLRLVALSIVISMLGAYATLELAERITAAHGRTRLWWEVGGGAASGLGTWSMHYVAMLAFSLPVPVFYQWPTVVLSYFPATFSAVVGLFLFYSWHVLWRRALVGSVLIGGGIAAMHYTAMASMRFHGTTHYSLGIVTVSVIAPMLLVLMALQLRFVFRREDAAPKLRRAASIFLLGSANPVMHFTGMAATSFFRSKRAPDLSHAVSISLVGAEAITIVPMMVLAVAAVTSVLDRLRQHEVLLRRALDAALEASRLKSALMANVSHEIRAPLNVMIGYVEVISDYFGDRQDESHKSAVEAIRRAASRLTRTIDNILDISKIESGGFSVAQTRLDLKPLLEHLVADLRVSAQRKGVSLTCTFETPDTNLIFDEYCLTQALTNLLDNAVKFTERGVVACRVYRSRDGVLCLDIRDTGIGISPEYLPHLFEPFSQEQVGTTRQYQGSGLGLALTRRYLELNGAEISVQTEKGKGTTFTIRFSGRSQAEDRT